MSSIILMDDRRTKGGKMHGGCQDKLEAKGVQCFFDDCRDVTGASLSTREAGQRLYNLAVQHQADGLVMDVKWDQIDPADGFDIWHEAKGFGLAMDRQMVVFLTWRLALKELHERAEDFGFTKEQVFYKNQQGIDGAVQWLCKRLGC